MLPSKQQLLNDCFLHDKERLRHEEALAILRERLFPVVGKMHVKLQSASGLFVAEDIHAGQNIPSTDNSAVDGYAYASENYAESGGFFPVVARIAAGDINPLELPKGAAARIFTGAVMPVGADTIAMQEDCEPHEQNGATFVAIPPGLRVGANCRKAGEDLMLGDIIAKAGQRLEPANIAAIASSGLADISVYKPLKVALISSGNELKRPGEPALVGQVYDSNHFLLNSLLSSLPVETTDLGVLPDDFETIKSTMEIAARDHDVILSTGGASRGEEDHIITALDEIGKRHLWQLAVKPGRPMSFGTIHYQHQDESNDCVFFGLPGNPVASFVCFSLYVRPALARLAGCDWFEPKRFFAKANFVFGKKKPDRREFWRGTYSLNNNEPLLEKFERDGSGLISGLRQSNCLIEIPEETTEVKKGDWLRFIPWSELGI